MHLVVEQSGFPIGSTTISNSSVPFTPHSSNGSLIVNLTQKVQFPLRQYFILTCSKSIIVKFFGIKFEIFSDTIKNRLRILERVLKLETEGSPNA